MSNATQAPADDQTTDAQPQQPMPAPESTPAPEPTPVATPDAGSAGANEQGTPPPPSAPQPSGDTGTPATGQNPAP